MTDSSAYPDLGHHGNNWVTQMGGLPHYIERIAKHLHYEKGKTVSTAIAIAVNVVKRMCATGDLNFHGIQHVAPPHKAAACEAIADFEAKAKASDAKTRAKAMSHLGAGAHKRTGGE